MKRYLESGPAAAMVGLVLLLAAVAPAAAEDALYSLSSVQGENLLRRIDPATGITLATVPIAVPGKTIFTANGLATQPGTGQLYALLTFEGDLGQRYLVTLDAQTGAGSIIGSTGDRFAGLAFAANGALFGVTGDGASTPETLYTLNPSTGQPTSFLPLGNGDDGEAIAYNPVDGQLYHASGIADQVFESINLTTKVISNIPLSGFERTEMTALTYSQAFFLGADLMGNFLKITPGGVVSQLGVLNHFSKGLAFAAAPAPTTLVASILPSSRSVDVATPATAFATIFNAGANTAFQAGIGLASPIPAFLTYNATSCATNAVIGGDNVAVNIPPNTPACFVITVSPIDIFTPTEVAFTFAALNAPAVGVLTGINTLLMSASATPVPDIVALAATGPPNNGIASIPGTNGAVAFAVATVNVGAGGLITASTNTGGAALPVNIQICETDSGTGVCKAPPAASVTRQIDAGQTPTYGIFVFGGGTVPPDPAANRVFVEFEAGGVIFGRTSVAVQTASP